MEDAMENCGDSTSRTTHSNFVMAKRSANQNASLAGSFRQRPVFRSPLESFVQVHLYHQDEPTAALSGFSWYTYISRKSSQRWLNVHEKARYYLHTLLKSIACGYQDSLWRKTRRHIRFLCT
ncbi:hypothetical protein CVT26_001592 [Gymnopilus dilepis]|uniref:Uncharacterized protein n=1 Tax=Gymnopilus dilepis TaxID=231916 RepID=A0A409VTM5_9AGAR|nr:hypothetical protein CVT26_001592 [Gymnopilus dilepis]